MILKDVYKGSNTKSKTLLKQVSDGFAKTHNIQETETIHGMELVLFLEPKASIKSIFRIAIVKEKKRMP